jgi:hypothetical protein
MSKRVLVAIGAAAAALVGTAIAVVPGVASGDSGVKSQLAPQELGQGKQLIARLAGSSEVPPADLGGTGVANISIDTTTNQICWSITVGNLSAAPTMAHIHLGAVGVNGQVVVPLFPPLPNPQSSGCTTDAINAPLIAANPSAYYVNVHTTAFPAGAIRGQLTAAPLSTVLLPAPLRAYDSRTADGKLQAGQTRTIGLASGKDASGASQIALPPGASAALVTLTVTQTEGAGFVTMYSAALANEPPTSSINWGGPDQILSVATPVAVDAQGRVKITGGVNPTSIVIDVVGYMI